MSLKTCLLFLERSWRRICIISASILALYAILGFWVLPAVLKRQIPKQLSPILKREVSLQKVKVNPFTFSITLEGFSVKDKDGACFLGWQRLYVNTQISSLFSNTLSFKTIEWIKPSGRIVVAKDGRLNFSDILDEFSKEAPQTVQPAPQGDPKTLSVGHLFIDGLSLSLLDQSPREPFATTLGPVKVELKNFKTESDKNNPYAFSGVTEVGERFAWKGTLSTEPLKSQGEFSLEGLSIPKYSPYFKDQFTFQLRDGKLSFKANYIFDWFNHSHAFKLQKGHFTIHDLAIFAPEKESPELKLPLVDATDIEWDLFKNALDIQNLQFHGLQSEVLKKADGTLNWTTLTAAPPTLPKPGVQSATPNPKEPAKGQIDPQKDNAFQLQIKALAFIKAQLHYRDEATARPLDTTLDIARLEIKHFTLDEKAPFDIDLDCLINQKSALKAKGEIKAFVPFIDLDISVDQLDMGPFDTYLEPSLALRISKGRFSAAGKLKGLFEGNKKDYVHFKGDTRLENFEAMDAALQEPFLRYNTFSLQGLDVRTNPDTMRIKRVRLQGFENRLVVAKDGSTNVARALKIPTTPETETSPDGDVKPPSSAASALPPTPESAFKLGIASILIQKGSLVYIDRTLEPNAALSLTNLQGTFDGLSTELEGQSRLDIKGLAGGLAPMSIQGKAKPLRHDQDTDVIFKLQGTEMMDFNPYAMKYLGYGIQKGKLDINAAFKIQNRALDAKIDTRMDQFFLGNKVKSPDAVKLPVKLALALLRDRKGIISLDLPIEGSLDDPNFRYGKIVWKTILNVLTKIATAPFDLIGKAFGGGGDRDLSQITFEAGRAQLPTDSLKTLDILAKSLIERPALNLEIEASVHEAEDSAALRKDLLEKRLRETKLKELQKNNPEQKLSEVALLDDERPRIIALAYREAFPAPKLAKGEKPQPLPPFAEMEQRLMGECHLEPGQLERLKEARSLRVIHYLQSKEGIDNNRIFKVQSLEDKAPPNRRVRFGLK